MPAIIASAPGKAILFGEHAVVYNRPAVAVPVSQVRARAIVSVRPRGQPDEVRIEAPEIGLNTWLSSLPENHALALLISHIKRSLDLAYLPSLRLVIRSSIPVAGGLGSGAAVSVAAARALSAFMGRPFNPQQVSAVAYEVEKKYHGTPSGIDNTVITYEQPIFFQRGLPFEIIHPTQVLNLVIADTGTHANTAAAVEGVRQRWQGDPVVYEALFDRIGHLAEQARALIEHGQVKPLGSLMIENHHLLKKMGVSTSRLDALVQAAIEAGAWGAKLSGAGLGGNIIALVDGEQSQTVAQALLAAGALRVISTQVKTTL